jgi:putative MATE family efflux protein
MTTPPVLWKAFLAFLAPLMLGNILQALSGTINNIFLGHMIGVKALAAATAFFPMIFLFIAFVIGLGAGSSVLIGQAWGSGRVDRVKAVAGVAITVALIGGVVIAVAGSIFAREILILFATPADIMSEALPYARVMMIFMPVLLVFLVCTSLLRGVGDTVSPLLALALSTLIGLGLTPALIRGWIGLPSLGVPSVAYAGAVSYCAALIWMGCRLRRKKSPLAPDAELWRHMRIDREILKKVLRIGLPTGFQMIIIAISEMVLLGLINHFGSDATAAYGAFNQILSYVQFPALSIAITVSVFGSQAIGAEAQERLQTIVRTGLLFNVFLTGGLIVIAYLFSRTLVGFFITSPAVIDLTETMVHIVLWSLVLFGMAGVFSGMMRASGTVLAPMALGITAILGVELPTAWLLSHSIGLPGVWIGYPAAFGAMLVFQSSYFFFVWRKRTITRLI